ncbi:DUF4880 domain-containing protein [Pseudomonas cannabina]|uniref:DUF4880 domain-containing protein n=1 Tax=Pseudomonas cannabina TaxID=86840 RepID=UPI00070A5FD1|nr:DUF4880 domain-containing protein [Pseudomonas cannabina]RMN80619.1 hypothetical protein ALQ52_02556 [Pseudomonas cannabina pv. alisalensis]
MSNQLSSSLHLPTRLPRPHASPEAVELSHRLRKLSRRTLQIFLLSRVDDLPYADIALFMDVEVARVERAMRRALGKAHVYAGGKSSDIQDQASRWYVHLQSPAATASERIEFRHWLDADAAHLSAFQNSERVWRQLQASALLIGASGWHRRKRRVYLAWCLLSAFACSLMVTAEAIS